MTARAGTPIEALRAFGDASRLAPTEPYRGLEPFRYADTGILAARENEIERLVRLVTMYRGVLLYGESGAGKTSVVNAGLLPRLVEEGFWPHRVRIQPRLEEEFVLEPIRTSSGADQSYLPSAFPAAPSDGRLVLAAREFVSVATAAADRGRILLVFDQFEELVTLFGEVVDGTETQRRVIDAVVRLLRSRDVRVKLLFVFREDYLANLEPLLAEQPELTDQSLRLVSPPVECASEIIRAPFERYPRAFGRELSPEFARVIAASLAERGQGRVLNLSELQVVCHRIVKAEDPRALFDARGVEGLLEEFLDERLGAFSDQAGGVAVALLTRLVTASGTRNVVSRSDLLATACEESGCGDDVVSTVLLRLEHEAHLVRSERRRDVTTYEIVSEFLVPMIARRKLERLAASERERALSAAVALHEEERASRRRRLLTRLALAACVAAIVIAGLAAYAWHERGRAVDERNQAALARDVAYARELAAAADGQSVNDPGLAANLALRSLGLHWTPEAENALRAALAVRAPLQHTFGGTRPPKKGSNHVAFSGSGRLLVGSLGDKVNIWNTATGKRVLGPVAHGDFPSAPIAVSPDDRYAVLNAADHTLREFDLATHKVVRRLVGHVKTAYLATFSPDGSLVASPGADGFVYLWHASDGSSAGDINTHDRMLGLDDAVFGSDSRELITERDDGLVEEWDMPSGYSRWSTRGISAITIAPRGRLAATTTFDGHLKVRDVRTGQVLGRLGSAKFVVDLARFGASGRVLAALARTSATKAAPAIRVWGVPSMHLRGSISPGYQVTAFALSPDGRLVVTAGAHGAALWDVRTGSELARLFAGGAPAWKVAFSEDGSRVVGAGPDGHLHTWDVRPVLREVVLRTRSNWSTDISPEGNRVATAGAGGSIAIWAVPSGAHVRTLPVTTAASVPMVAFSPDGRTLVTPRGHRDVAVWNATSGALVRVLHSDGSGGADSVAFSPDGRAVMAAIGKSSYEWRVADGRQRRRFPAGSITEDATYSPDGRQVATVSDDGRLRIWTRATDRLVLTLAPRRGHLYCVAYSADGRYVAAGSSSGAVIVWDARTGRRAAILLGHTGWVGVVKFGPDNRHLLTSSSDGTVRLWDWKARVGAVVASTMARGGASADMSKDGSWLSVAGRGRTVVLVRCRGCLSLRHIEALGQQVARKLTPAERQKYLHAGERGSTPPY